MNSCCGFIKVDLVMEPPAQPYPGYSGGSCSVILASGHQGLAQSRRDRLENGSTFLGPKVGAPLCDELDGAARGTRGSMGVRACLEKRAVSRGAAWACKRYTPPPDTLGRYPSFTPYLTEAIERFELTCLKNQGIR